MSRTAPLAAAFLALFAASPAWAFGTFSPKKLIVSGTTGLMLVELNCTDGIDNDGDGDIDGWDSDCSDYEAVPTIDVGGSANPGGDDIMPVPDFFLAWSDDGSDVGLYTLTGTSTDRQGNTTYTYQAALTDLGSLYRSGYLEGMSASAAEADGDGLEDLVVALPAYGTGLVMAYADINAGKQSLYDYTGFLYTSYSAYSCDNAGRSTYCTDNVASNLMLDAQTGTVLVDLGYADYYSEDIGFRWAFDGGALRSGAAEDGTLAYVKYDDVYYY